MALTRGLTCRTDMLSLGVTRLPQTGVVVAMGSETSQDLRQETCHNVPFISISETPVTEGHVCFQDAITVKPNSDRALLLIEQTENSCESGLGK